MYDFHCLCATEGRAGRQIIHFVPPPPPSFFQFPSLVPIFHPPLPSLPPWWPQEQEIGVSPPAFPGQVIPGTDRLVLKWLPSQASGVVGSVLGLVGPVSVYFGCAG